MSSSFVKCLPLLDRGEKHAKEKPLELFPSEESALSSLMLQLPSLFSYKQATLIPVFAFCTYELNT